MWRSTSNFCNSPWVVIMNRTGIIKEDLWPSDCVGTHEKLIEMVLEDLSKCNK